MLLNARTPEANDWTTYFEGLAFQVFDTYEVTAQESREAVQVLRTFFHIKRNALTRFLVLPQLADWAWHEFILDTGPYEHFCQEHFGDFLHHLKAHYADETAEALESVFRQDLCELALVGKLDLDRSCWMQAGWENPRYRLRSPLKEFEPTHIPAEGIDPVIDQLDLSWLSERLEERYDLIQAESATAVYQYRLFLSERRRQRQVAVLSSACDAAWKEHVLWTSRYAQDCHTIFGKFLHRPARIDAKRACFSII